MIKFDISGIPKNSTLSSAEVLVYDYCALYSGEKQLCAYTDNWDDMTITWSNAATEGQVLSSFYTLVMYGWENFDVKSYLSSALQSDKKWVSFYIKQVYDGYRAHFYPSESIKDVSLRPKLVLEGNIPTDMAVNQKCKTSMSEPFIVTRYGGKLHIVTPVTGRQMVLLVTVNGRRKQIFNGVPYHQNITAPFSVSTGVYIIEIIGTTSHRTLKTFIK